MSQISFGSILSGKAIFTLVSLKTGDRFTYKIEKKGRIFFVKVLCGCDNETSYSFLGYFKSGGALNWSLKSLIPPSDKKWLAIKYLFSHPDTPYIEIHHAGRCLKCGKLLTTPKSIESGFGPKCRNQD